ncbi:hypothetical protein [Collimonas pratensis]|uniref:Uncharacterized protein n=1 Tax=Collimonas pratensis TaxID=279113 RepID=A0A127Q6V6_9BURK|nr:hypothetical protein [Collimonas pratensis]AMP05382.1 hypothetical protein CPter91_3043 [Collimonas pratensis]
MKVWIQLNELAERVYEQVIWIDDSSKSKIILHGQHGILAMLDRDDVRNLLTDEM